MAARCLRRSPSARSRGRVAARGRRRRSTTQADQAAAQGFIKIHGLSQQTQARTQMLKDGRGFDLPELLKHDEK